MAMTLADVRAKYPAYAEVDDQTLADALYRKYYPTADRREFDARVGLTPYQGPVEGLGASLYNIPSHFQKAASGLQQQVSEGAYGDPGAFVERMGKPDFKLSERPEIDEVNFIIWAKERLGIAPGATLTPDDRLMLESFGRSDKSKREFSQLAALGGQALGTDAAQVGAAQQIAAEQRASIEASAAPVDMKPGSAESIVSNAVASTAEMLPALAVSMILRNPVPAMTQAQLMAQGTAYSEARAAGISPDEASNYAVMYGLAEGIPEALPISILLKPGMGLVSRIVKEAGAEGIQEGFTEFLQVMLDSGTISPDMTWGQVWPRVQESILTGTVGGAIVAPIAHAGQAIDPRNKAPEAPPEAAAPVAPPPEPDSPIEDSVGPPTQQLLALPSPESFAPHPASTASQYPTPQKTETAEPPPDPNYLAKIATQRTRQAETAELLQTAKETITPLGTFTLDELQGVGSETVNETRDGKLRVKWGRGGQWHDDGVMNADGTITSAGTERDRQAAESAAQKVRQWRIKTGKDVEAPVTIEDLARARVPQAQIDALIETRRPFTEGQILKAADVLTAATAKNIINDDGNFAELAFRTTGSRNVERMTQAQLRALKSVLDTMPAHKAPVTLPIADSAGFSEADYDKAVEAVRKAGRYTQKSVKDATGVTDSKHADAIRDAMVRRGQLTKRAEGDYRLYDVIGKERHTTPDDLPPGAIKNHVIRRVPVNGVRVKRNGKSLGVFTPQEAREKVRVIRDEELNSDEKDSEISLEEAENTSWGVFENRYDEEGNFLGQAVVDTARDEAGARALADRLDAPPTEGPIGAKPLRKAPPPAALVAKMPEIVKRLSAIASKRKLPLLGTKVKIERSLEGVTADGSMFDAEGVALNNIIYISAANLDPSMTLDEITEKLAQVMDHELIHALRTEGVLGPNTEGWRSLSRYVKRQKQPGTTQTYFERAKEIYTGLPSYENPDSIVEEAIAEAFRVWAANRRNVVGQPASVFRQIVQWFKNLVDAMEPTGVFTAIETGQLVENFLQPPGSTTPRAKAAKKMADAQRGVKAAEAAQQAPLIKENSIEFLKARAQAREDRVGRSGPKTVHGTTPTKAFNTGDLASVESLIERFKAAAGMTSTTRLPGYLPEDIDYLKRVADAQQRAKHETKSDAVEKAYRALIEETKAMFKALGPLEVVPWDGNGAPYDSPSAMLEAIANGRLKLRLSAEMFGEGADNQNHPMYRPSGFTATDGSPLLNNDLFRIVHEVYGRGQIGLRSTPRDDYNAYHEHARLLSAEARKALATETLAQSAWHSYGPHLRRSDGTVPREADIDYLKPELREFAEQKAFLLSDDVLAADPGWALSEEGSPRYMVSWHGTPHKVDKFALDKIGTGEGAQAFGWGLYFAGKKEVAEYYRQGLSSKAGFRDRVHVDGVPYTNEIGGLSPAVNSAIVWVDSHNGDTGKAIRELRAAAADDPTERMRNYYTEGAQWLEDNQARISYEGGGNLYKVDIPEEDELLDWDAPLSEQSLAVRAFIEKTVDEAPPDSELANIKSAGGGLRATITGEQFYRALSQSLRKTKPKEETFGWGFASTASDGSDFGGDRRASEALKAAGIPGHRYRDAVSRITKEKGSHNYVIYDDERIQILEENPRYMLTKTVPGLKGVLKHLTPEERAELKKQSATKLVEIFEEGKNLIGEFAALAYSGRAKRGWYQRSAQAIVEIFGISDAPRFVALLAATSPQTGVEDNAINALNIWVNWNAAGRPTDRTLIMRIMGQSVQGKNLEKSALNAWKNNTFRALSSVDPANLKISGPKVQSFSENLRGYVNEVTNDAWMANVSGFPQKMFSRSTREAPPGDAIGGDFGYKSPGYMAMSAIVRAAAKTVSKMTGETWTPSEVQETIWSWAKMLTDHSKNAKMSADAYLAAGLLTHDTIASTPDFASLFVSGVYRNILERGGYDRGIRAAEDLSLAFGGADRPSGDIRSAEGTGFAQRTFNAHLRNAAERLQLRREQGKDPDGGRGSAAGEPRVSPIPPGPSQGGQREADGSLAGLPRKVKGYSPSVFPKAVKVAENYMAAAGLPYNPPATYARVDPIRAARIATEYDLMKDDPQDPAVAEAYQAMIRETLAQYDAILATGLVAEFIDTSKGDPYSDNPRNMTEDVRNNNHMWVFPTDAGFGSNAAFDASGNPLLIETPYKISGRAATANDIFRVVHDYFGHVKEGLGFRADGEENAWRSHSAMYSPAARRAMTSETRGQNSWVNYGPHGEQNRTALSGDTVFADQKIGLLPQWAIEEGAGDPVVPDDTARFSILPEHLPGGKDYGKTDRSPGGALSKPETSSPAFTNHRDGNVFFGGEIAELQLEMARDGERGTTMIFMQPEDFLELAKREPEKGAKFSLTATPEFKRWFGDSKVVDENGEPLVVYHGTDRDFEAFRVKNRGLAYYFTPDPQQASSYAGKGSVYPVYLKAENPYAGGRVDEIVAAAKGLEDDFYPYSASDMKRMLERQSPTPFHKSSIIKALKSLGYDGFIEIEGGIKQFGVFKSTQIKSVFNRGTFDPNDPNIRYSIAKNPEQDVYNEAVAKGYKFNTLPSLVIDGYAGNVRVTDSDGAYAAEALKGRAQWIPVVLYPKKKESLGHVTALEGNGRRVLWPHEGRQENFPDARPDGGPKYSLTAPPGRRVPPSPSPDAFNIVYQRTEGLIGRALRGVGRSKRNIGLPFAGSIFDARIKLQDAMLSVKDMIEKIREQGGTVNDLNDTYMLEQLYHGEVVAEIEERETRLLLPLLNALKAASGGRIKVTPEDLGNFLMARHVPERNAYLRAHGAPMNDPSGVTDREASDIMDKFALAGKTPALQQLAARADAVIKDTNLTRLKAGLISQEMFDSQHFQYYVPFKGIAEEDLDPDMTTDEQKRARSGRGFSIGGREDRSMTGRKAKPADILGHIFVQNTETVIRAEKNAVAQSFIKLVQDNPTSGFAQVLRTAPTKLVRGPNGMIHAAGDPNYRGKDDIVIAKFGGKEVIVQVIDTRIARAIKSDYVSSSGNLVKVLGTLNRYLATINTSLNPEFIISNLARDAQTAGILSAQYDIRGLGRKIITNAPAAMKGISEVLRKGTTNSAWAKAFAEMRANGGTTEFLGINDLELQMKRLRNSIGAAGLKATGRMAYEQVQRVGKFIDDYNRVAENAYRLAAYVAAREAGVSVKQAAFLAKNLTVNFNKGGEMKVAMNASYLFYNASLQGTMILLNGLRNKRVRRIAGAVVIAGLGMELLNRMLSDDDDENGITDYDEIPDYILRNNIILMDPLGILQAIGIERGYFSFPMPYGFNAFFNLGRNIGAVYAGGKDPWAAGADIAVTALDSFNPLGGAQDIVNFIAPTWLDPAADLALNRDYAGNTIVPERPSFGAPTPESQKYWSNTDEVPKFIAEQINALGGGNKYRPGEKILNVIPTDISPEVLQFVFDFATGATGKFAQRVTSLAVKTPQMLQGDFEDIAIGDIPFARRLVGSIGERENTEAYYEIADEIALVSNELDGFMKDGNRPAFMQVMARSPLEARLVPMFKAANELLGIWRKQIRDLREMTEIKPERRREVQRVLEERMDAKMREMVRLYMEVKARTLAAAA